MYRHVRKTGGVCVFPGGSREMWYNGPLLRRLYPGKKRDPCRDCMEAHRQDDAWRKQALRALNWVLFDLDGTLTDSSPGILNSVVYALEKMGVTPPAREELYSFIGPPLKRSFQSRFGFDDAQAVQAIQYYREYFSAGGLFENAVYPGIPEALERLRGAGKKLCVVTSKPEEFSLRIVEHFGLLPYFQAVCGASMDASRTEKAQVLRYALDRLGISPEECLMVGDREHDVLGAKEVSGIPCLGVLWGYGSRKELSSAGAFALAENPDALADRILKL